MIQNRKIASFSNIQRSYLLAVFIQMLLEGLPCRADRACQFNDSKFFMGEKAKVEDVSAGQCSFGEDKLCRYSVTCTDEDAKSWSLVNGQAVCQGKDGKFNAFSVLLSPVLNIKEEMCLEFNFSQSSPGRLSVFLATSKELVYIKPEEIGEGNFSRLTYIKPSIGTIGFRARSPNARQNVTLWNVSLVKGSCRSVPACSSVSGDIQRICAWNVPQAAQEAGNGSKVGSRYAGIIAGTLLFLAVVIIIFLVGFFHRRKYVQQENRNKNDDSEARVVNDSRNPVAPTQRHPDASHRPYQTMHRSEGEDNHAYAEIDDADVKSLTYLQYVIRKEREHSNSNTATNDNSLANKDRQTLNDVNDGYNYATPTCSSIADDSKATPSDKPREENAYLVAHIWEASDKGGSRTQPVPKSRGEEYNTLTFDSAHPGANLATRGDAHLAYSHIAPGAPSSYDRVQQINSNKNKGIDSHYSHLV